MDLTLRKLPVGKGDAVAGGMPQTAVKEAVV